MEKVRLNPTSLTLAKSAIEADEKGQYQVAFDRYGLLIEGLIQELKAVQAPDKQQALKKTINSYLQRAETIKTLLPKEKAARAPKQPAYAAPTKTSTQNIRQPIKKKSATKPTTTTKPSTKPKASAKPAATREQDKFSLMILDEVLDKSPGVTWNDIAGLHLAKQVLQESVILPTLRPDIFTGLRAPPRGVLLFGPPGTGKTLIAKAVATESDAHFFCISASSLTSKWVGEGEKMVRALFSMARELQPSVVFIDEIDSLLSSRKANEHDASRRIKNQFLVELDGASSNTFDRVLVLGATNLPHELDEAVVRRLEKRIYIPLPDDEARGALFRKLLGTQSSSLSDRDYIKLVRSTKGYSGSDIHALCREASLGPIRALGSDVRHAKKEEIRSVQLRDFEAALKMIKPSVRLQTLQKLEQWNEAFGAKI